MTEREHRWIHDEPDEPSYLVEMLKTPISKNSAIGALGLGALLSIPFGLGLGAVPLVVYAAGVAIASMFVPSSPAFKDKVDARRRAEKRGRVRQHLTDELLARVDSHASQWSTYNRMRERVASLEGVARSASTNLNPRNVESLDDSTVDFLGLWLAALTMKERWQEIDEDALARRIAEIERSLEGDISEVDRRHLHKALTDLRALLDRKKSLWSRATAVDTAMMTLADQFEEIYQRVVRNPNANSIGDDVRTAIDRMRLEEEIDLEVDADIEVFLRPERRARQTGLDRARAGAKRERGRSRARRERE